MTVAARLRYCACWCESAFSRALRDCVLVLVFHAGTKFVAPSNRLPGENTARGGDGDPERRTSNACTGLLVDGSSCVCGACASIDTGMRPEAAAALDCGVGDCERCEAVVAPRKMDDGVGDRRPPLMEPREGETPSFCADGDMGGGDSER